jgi:hypothetical protein
VAHPQIDIVDSVNKENHQRRNDGKEITDSEIHKEEGIEEIEKDEGKDGSLLSEPLALEGPR